MKKSLILVGMLAIGYANAQYDGKVGINTDQPKATLDLNVANVNKDKTTNEGILAPRLSKTRVANIAVPQEGTLVYVTNETDSPISAYTGTDTKVEKITEKGYYYYNGEQWVSNGGKNENIYNTNGTLSSDRTINGNDKSLIIHNLKAFYINSEFVEMYDNKDSDFRNLKTLFIDVQQLKAKTLLTGGVIRGINLASTTTTDDRPVVADKDGILKIGTYTDTSIYNNDGTLSAKRTVNTDGNDLSFTGTGKIGIGVATPTQKLDVDGSIKSSSLQGTGDRNVVASADGTLKIGTTTTTPIPNVRWITSGYDDNLLESDNGGFVYVNSSANEFRIYVPKSLPTGFSCVVVRYGRGDVTIGSGAGMSSPYAMYRSARGPKLRAQYSAVGIIKQDANYFTITGDAIE